MKHIAEAAVPIAFFVLVAVLAFVQHERRPASPVKTETLTCVRVKEVTPAGTINYLCEVKNGRP